MVHHFDALSVYRAGALRLVPVAGTPEDLLQDGGGLAEAFDLVGQGPIVGVLRDSSIAAVVLSDGELSVEVRRDGAGARLIVRWSGVVAVDDAVEVPSVVASGDGPWLRPDPSSELSDARAALADVTQPLHAVRDVGGKVRWFTRGLHGPGVGQMDLAASVPAVTPESLGSADFRAAHGVRRAYVAGAMAGGIASVALVRAMCQGGYLAFFGSGGLPIEATSAAVAELASLNLPGAWGANLLHNPVEPAVEDATVDAYLQHGVKRVEASAFMTLTPAIVRYRLAGLKARPDGTIDVGHHVMAKVSRTEVATKFLQPAPEDIVRELLARGTVTTWQATLAKHVPMADDVTGEADSGGHTDHRPLVVLLPVLLRLRDKIDAEHGFSRRAVRTRIGAAGGLGTPTALWGAFAMGADYVLTGSVNQCAPESGTSNAVRLLLADAAFHDVATGPAPDMFEIGAKVQVLGRGAMYAQRAQKLHDLYKRFDDLSQIPEDERKRIETQIFRRPLDEVWTETKSYWEQRDPAQVVRAEADGHHKMALVFRWYLGMTSRWARMGEEDRKRDFQIWCGPAMGAFNAWAAGTDLEPIEARGVVRIADALMEGAAGEARRSMARTFGLHLPIIG